MNGIKFFISSSLAGQLFLQLAFFRVRNNRLPMNNNFQQITDSNSVGDSKLFFINVLFIWQLGLIRKTHLYENAQYL